MRSKNALRNLVVSLAYEVFLLALGLIVPRFIILSYGDSINGLTQTINRLLTLVNLLQAGAVGASIFQMLKPVADNDVKTQSEILYASKKFFDRMGIIYLAIVSACAVFYGFYLQDDNLSVIEVILSFMVLAVNGALYFFFTSRHDIVFSSYQKKYLLTVASFVEKITYYILLFLVIWGELHFIFMYLALLSGGIVRVLINSYSYHKLVGKTISRNPENKDFKIKDRKFLMLASISDQTIAAAPTIIITTAISLAASSVFSVYSMIYISMKTLINSVHHAVSAIFGNLVTTGDDASIGRVFDVLLYVFCMLGTFLASCSAFLFMNFIELYSDGFTEINYIEPVLACFIVAYIAIFAVKTVFNFVANAYGLFKLTFKATIIFGAVGLLCSIISTIVLGMPYVMIGVLIYHVGTTCILIASFNKQIPWFKINSRWLPRLVITVILPMVSWILYKSDAFFLDGWLGWFITAVIYALAVITVILVYTVIFERDSLSILLGYVKAIFKSKKKVNP